MLPHLETQPVISPQQIAAKFAFPENPPIEHRISKKEAFEKYWIGYLGLLDQQQRKEQQLFNCYPVIKHQPAELYGGQVLALWQGKQIVVVDKDNLYTISIDPNDPANLDGVIQFQIPVKDSIRTEDGSYESFTRDREVTIFPPAEEGGNWEVCEDVGIADKGKIFEQSQTNENEEFPLVKATPLVNEPAIKEWMGNIAKENTKCLWFITGVSLVSLGLRSLLKRIM